jgi:hypothetical protein
MKILYISKKHNEKRMVDSVTHKHASRDFAIVNILKSMITSVALNNKDQKVGLIVSPGCLSRSSYTAEKLYSHIFDNHNFRYHIGMLNGYKSSSLYWEYFMDFISKRGNFLPAISFYPQRSMRQSKTGEDHRKVIFIYDSISCSCVETGFPKRCLHRIFTGRKDLRRWEIDNFVNNINICGIFIGSSNFSYSTYLGGDRGEAGKGRGG